MRRALHHLKSITRSRESSRWQVVTAADISSTIKVSRASLRVVEEVRQHVGQVYHGSAEEHVTEEERWDLIVFHDFINGYKGERNDDGRAQVQQNVSHKESNVVLM